MKQIDKTGGKSYAAWANIVLIPAKQHFVCCGVLPVAVSALGGAGAAEFLHTPQAEIGMFLVVPPVVTYGVMLAEQKYHHYKERHKERRAAKTQQLTENASCVCARKTLTRANFLKQTALGYAFYAAAYMVLPQTHNHADCHHPHDHGEHTHGHTSGHHQGHHQGCDHQYNDQSQEHDLTAKPFRHGSAWGENGYIRF